MSFTAEQWRDLLLPGMIERNGATGCKRETDILYYRNSPDRIWLKTNLLATQRTAMLLVGDLNKAYANGEHANLWRAAVDKVFPENGREMPLSDAQIAKATDAIQALIQSRPWSPKRDAIERTLREALTP